MAKKNMSFREETANNDLRVYSNITQLIANPKNPTPLVRVNKTNISREKGFEIYLKLERYNPFGSIKDRTALEMLKSLTIEDRTIVEPSSGNTGIALTCIANALGIPVEIVVPQGIPEEKKIMLRLLGAKVMEADDDLCPLFPNEGARGLVKSLVESPATRDSYISPNQYESPLNVQAHYQTTGPEIWDQTKGKVDYVFVGLGTCGTITGIGRCLKKRNPEVKIIGVEPSSQHHKLPGMRRITGLDEEFLPKFLDELVIDDIVEVTDENAYKTAIDIARKDGIPVGPTTGAILYAALRYGVRKKKGLAVVISPDDAFKYATFFQEFFREEFVEEKTKKVEVDEDEHDGLEESKRDEEEHLLEINLCGVMCPASKIKASEFVDSLAEGSRAKIILGDTESLKNVASDLKERGIISKFKEEENRSILTFIK